MNTPGDLQPQRVLTPRRKRAFLSFRRKSDLLWFLTSVVMFSGGIAAFVLAVFYIGPTRKSIPMPAATPPPLPAPERTSLSPLPPSLPSTGIVDRPRADESKARPRTEDRRPSPPLPKPLLRPKPLIVLRSPAPAPKTELKVLPPVSDGRDLHRGGTTSRLQKRREYLLLEESNSFKSDAENEAKVVVESIDSAGEPAVQLTYDLRGGAWVRCFVNVHENFLNFSRVQFLFKGEGANNTLEFRMVDVDGSTVGTLWSEQTGKKAWTVVDIPLTDLTYLWGGDSTLDKGRVRQIIFVISKKSGDAGGRGRVTLRGIKFS